MIHSTLRGLAPLTLLALASLVAPATAQHQSVYRLGDLEITEPWTRATPGGAVVAGGFMRIANKGAQPDRLVGGAFSLSKRFEIHEMKMDGGVMQMRPLDKGLEIPAGATVELKPGGYHVMMIDLTAPVRQGAPLRGALQFEKAGKIEIDFMVAPIGASAPPSHGH